MVGVEREKEELKCEESQGFVVEIENYEGGGRSERLLGLLKLRSIGAITPEPVFVVTHSAFEEYTKSGVTAKLQDEIFKSFERIIELNPDRGVFLGWRSVTPEGELPPGPRTGPIYSKEDLLKAILKSWEFAREQKYDTKGAEVALAVHPFIDASNPPMEKEPFGQWPGGDVTPLPDGQVSIRATYGPDEAVQGYPCDQYWVRVKEDGISITWRIAKKDVTLEPHEGGYRETDVHPDYQNKQALTISQIAEIARTHQEIWRRYGPHRLEFILQPEGVVFRECVPFDVKEEDFFFLKEPLSLPVIVINSKKDIERVKPPKAIVYFPPEIFQDRSIVPISIQLASQAKEEDITLVVISSGSIATQHMVRRFRDFGQTVLFAGEERLVDGMVVRVFRDKEGRPRWERVEEKQNNFIIDLRDKGIEDAPPKARNLATLSKHNIPVPDGFYLSEKLFRQQLESLGVDLGELDNLRGEDLRKRCEEIRDTILHSTLPDSLKEQIEEKISQSPDGKFSVRSAEAHEDGNIARAGLFKSFIGVPKEEVLKAIIKCWAEIFSPPTIEYLGASGVSPSEIEIGVLIHKTIEGKGGVMYTGPNTIITAGESPEAVTSGTGEKVQKVIVKRGIREKILSQEIPRTGKILNEGEIKKLVALGSEIEEIFGEPQDIEFVITPNGETFILQTRPL